MFGPKVVPVISPKLSPLGSHVLILVVTQDQNSPGTGGSHTIAPLHSVSPSNPLPKLSKNDITFVIGEL